MICQLGSPASTPPGGTGSLAALPLLQPDVVKLDMSLVHQVPDRSAAAVTAAVRSYAERSGAVILAEGVETAEHEKLARVLGASFVQGYRYGAPGTLPSSVPAPRQVIPLRQRPAQPLGNTPFDVASAAASVERGTKDLLLHMSTHLEAQCVSNPEPSVLLAGFQHARYFSDSKLRHYQELAKHNVLTVVIAEGVASHAEPRFQVAPLLRGSRMRQEWAVIVLGSHYAAAFLARDCGDTGPDGQRRLDFVYTHDRDLVVAAGRCFLQELLPLPAAKFLSPVTPAQREAPDLSVPPVPVSAGLFGRRRRG